MLRAWDAGTTEESAMDVLADVCATEMTNMLAQSLGIEGKDVGIGVDAEEVMFALDLNKEETTVGEVNMGGLPVPAVVIRQDGRQFVVLKQDMFSALN